MSSLDDPLGQTLSAASSDHYVKKTYVQTTRVKIIITTVRDLRSAEWIKNTYLHLA